MKKILLLIGMTTLALASCNKLDELPDNKVEKIDTPEKIKNVLTSAYPKTSNTYITELASDNIADNGAAAPGVPFFAIEAAYWKPIKEYWDIDGLYLGKTKTFHQFDITLPSGYHILTVTDDGGNSKNVGFYVK